MSYLLQNLAPATNIRFVSCGSGGALAFRLPPPHEAYECIAYPSGSSSDDLTRLAEPSRAPSPKEAAEAAPATLAAVEALEESVRSDAASPDAAVATPSDEPQQSHAVASPPTSVQRRPSAPSDHQQLCRYPHRCRRDPNALCFPVAACGYIRRLFFSSSLIRHADGDDGGRPI